MNLLQLTHKYDVGYDWATVLLIEADGGITLATLQIHLKVANAVHTTGLHSLQVEDHRLNQLESTMD